MRKNRIREKWIQDKMAVGTYVNLADPAVVEIIGLAGFDAAFIDMEHTAFSLETVQEMLRACDLMGIASLVRVPDNNPKTILRILDMGAQGVQVPHIGGINDAMNMVKAVRYAPLGERGMGGPTRAARYGAFPSTEHLETSNSEILLSVMVEDKTAIDELEDIASIEGIDLVTVGPTDLAQALGIPENEYPRLMETIERIAAILKKVGKAKLALPLNLPAFPLTISQLKTLGVAYANCGPADVGRLMNSYKNQIDEISSHL
jgi:2-keto-3-deoxy-L-rhamnonate aldolase RhmA